MKKITQFIALIMVTFVLAACNNSLERATRTVGLMQEDMSKIVNQLSEIQMLESNLQSDFDNTLAGTDDLNVFLKEDSPVSLNLSKRKEHLTTLKDTMNSLVELADELIALNKNTHLPVEQFTALHHEVKTLESALTVYITDYQNGLAQESISFKSIANPDADYANFFGVMSNVNQLAVTNNINLDKVLPSFEPINSQLINVKVTLVNMADNK
ncbi:YkyA family protein [Aerococcaceae bacterium NML191292]|nr:YkyA family protein [Aerococcaceae bacterium NML191292]MCW6676994.1 YkyA family protein [Aerococcaceae bacterium NML180378]MCW6682633.1 YkyA family protein [Aerococcaceae bacterium NML160702]